VHPLIQCNHTRRSLTAAPTLNRRGATSHKKEFQGTLRSRQGCHHRLVWGEAFNVGSTCATAITQATGHRLNCHRGPAPSSLPPTIFVMPVLLFTLFRRNKNLPRFGKKSILTIPFLLFFSTPTVTVTIKSMVVKVKGPRGELEINMRKFKRLCDITVKNGKVKVDIWHATRKEIACLRSLSSKVENMIIGVTQGFLYKMRFVYNHFPINSAVEGGNKLVIKNFLGERRPREIQAQKGVTMEKSKDVKDQLEITGNDVDCVSLTAAQINDSCKARNKDIRKFLDGVYISERTFVTIPELD
jgi:large subunit ribosomal protein L9e